MSAEYGWSDKKIMNTPIRRLRQILAAINRRRYIEGRERRSELSWQTRILASYVAAGYMTEGDNPAIEAALEIAYDEIEETQLEEAREALRQREAAGPVKKKEPEPGSYERFLGSMANPTRWAGGK